MLSIKTVLLVGIAWAYVLLNIQQTRSQSTYSKRGLNGIFDQQIPLKNAVSYYQADLKIGNPPQVVTVQLDTGSSDLWIISSNNTYCKEIQCRSSSTFDTTLSSTLKSNNSSPVFTILYGDSTFARGIYVQDDVEILGAEGDQSSSVLFNTNDDDKAALMKICQGELCEIASFAIRDANFAIAEKANSSESVWGIGLAATESMARNVNDKGELYPTYPNIPIQMKQQGLIDRVAYSLWLNDLQSATGSLLFGAVDHAKYLGQLQTIPMISSLENVKEPSDFSVILHGISAYNAAKDEAELVSCSLPVLLDSGTTYSQLPTQLLNPIIATLGATYDERHQIYIINGTRKQQLHGGGLTFDLSGIKIDVSIDEILLPIGSLESIVGKQPFDLHTDAINVEYPNGGTEHKKRNTAEQQYNQASQDNPDNFYYLLGIFGIEPGSDDAYILGDTFLRSAYVVYDLESKEVAMANARHNSSQSAIEKIGPDGIPSARKAELYSATQVSDHVVAYSVEGLFAQTACQDNEGNTKVNCGNHGAQGQTTMAMQDMSEAVRGINSNTALGFNPVMSKSSPNVETKAPSSHHVNNSCGVSQPQSLVIMVLFCSIPSLLFFDSLNLFI